MTEWTKVKLGDIATFSNGINFGKDSYCQGVKLIGVSDFGNRLYPDYSSLQEVKTEVVRNNDYLKNGDIVFVRSNGNKELVGRCMLITGCHPFVTFSGFCIRARLNDTSKFNPLYFAYHFKNMEFRKAMSGTAVGANIQNLSQGRLAQYETLIPDIVVQNKIATILSRYDDLIENYQKQIKLLEEATQRLYKEWFVDLHFPGYENVKVVDGVPEGWEKKCLEEIASIKAGGDKPKTFSKVKTEKLHVPVYSNGAEDKGLFGYTDKCIVNEKSVTISARGNIGFISLRLEPYVPIVRLLSVVPLKGMNVEYLYAALKKTSLQGNGAAQQQLTVPLVSKVLLLVPNVTLLNEYSRITSMIYRKILLVEKQIEHLTEARDRLLPKLMSGEIEV